MSLSDWLPALVVAVIASTSAWWSARLARKTGRELGEAARLSAVAQLKTADAARESASAATGAASVATRAEEALERSRMHDGTIQTLYWAADHAVSGEAHKALLGLEVLGALTSQANSDHDYRSGRILGATHSAVKKVAIPTFLSVLTSAVSDQGGEGDGGSEAWIQTSSIVVNAARLLVSHAHDLEPSLMEEITQIAEAVPGARVAVRRLYAGRHIELSRGRAMTRTQSLGRQVDLGR